MSRVFPLKWMDVIEDDAKKHGATDDDVRVLILTLMSAMLESAGMVMTKDELQRILVALAQLVRDNEIQQALAVADKNLLIASGGRLH